MSIRKGFSFIIPLVILSCFILALSLCAVTANSAEAETPSNYDVTIAHITDMHVFLNDACNNNSQEYLSSEASFNMLYYSQEALMAVLDKIKSGEDTNGKTADYLIVTGDLTANGEREGHEFVANTLREAQTYMRTTGGKPNFQIFVVPGNHDLYNDRATRYYPSQSELEGLSEDAKADLIASYTQSKKQALPVSLTDFYEIYSGLGYGGDTLGTINYFFKSTHFYGNSNDDYKIALNTTSQLTTDQLTKYKDGDINALDAPSRAGGLSYIAKMPDGLVVVAFDSNRVNYSEVYPYTDLKNRLGDAAVEKFHNWTYGTSGDINKEQLRWMKETLDGISDAKMTIALSHHSLVPHTDMEDDILTSFMADNFRTASYFLADNGVRYVFTGHVHENDVATYVSQKGNVLYDIETPSTAAYGAGYRVVELHKYADNKEQLYDSVFTLSSLASSGKYADVIKVLDNKTTAVRTLLTHNYLNVNLVNKLKAKTDTLIGKDLPLSLKIGQPTADLLKTLIDGLVSLDLIKPELSSNGTYSFGTDPTPGYNIFAYIIDLINYVFDMDVSCGRITGGYSVEQIAMDIYRKHLVGAEPVSVTDAAFEAVLEACTSGDFTEKLINTLIDWLMPQLTLIFDAPLNISATPIAPNTGFDLSSIYPTIQACANQEVGKMALDLLSSNNVTSIRTLVIALNKIAKDNVIKTIINGINSSAVSKVLEYAGKITKKTVLSSFVKTEILDKYATHALFVNLGCYVKDILLSFAVDSSPEGGTTSLVNGTLYYSYPTNKLLTLKDGDTFTYFGGPLSNEENPATIEDGRLPSMISIARTDSGANFKWFTRIQASDITSDDVPDSYFYYHVAGVDNWSYFAVSGTPATLTIPLIDLGVIYITHTTVTYQMYEVNASWFEDGKTYYYQVGNKEKGWLSEVRAFSTKKTPSGEVSILALSDIQGSVEENYLLTKTAAEIALETIGDIDFVVSAGDNVDKGDNTYHWEWLLNHNQNIFAGYSLVSAAGNHEDGDDAIKQYLAAPTGAKFTGEDNDSNGYYYSFDVENVHITVLNTNDITSAGKLDSKQINWLKNDLSATTSKWKVVLMHKGIYTAGSHAFDTDVCAMRTQLAKIFADYGVNIVLQGHDHCYSVSQYINAEGNPIDVQYDDYGKAIAPNGVVYVNMGTLGDKFYNYLYRDDVPLKSRSDMGYIYATPLSQYFDGSNLEITSAPVFCSLRANATSLDFVSYAVVDGKAYLVDTISIVDSATTLTGSPDFSIKVSDGKSSINVNQRLVKDDTKLSSFFVEDESGVITYYKGYSISSLIGKDYISVNSKNYYSNSCYVALYSSDTPNGNYMALSSAKTFLLREYNGPMPKNNNLPGWAITLIVVGSVLVIGGGATAAFLIIRKKKSIKPVE